MIRILAVAAAMTLTVYVAPAHAASVAVSYSDLDLTSAQGRATLNARIDRAARQVCDTKNIGDLRQMMEANACYRVALASAQPKLAALVSRHNRAAG